MKHHHVGRRSLVWTLTLAILLLNWATVISGRSFHQKPKADLSRLVVVGDSLSAGFQSGSLIETAQVNGYAALIANQAGVDLALPLIASPGVRMC